jgi:glucosamine-6-phosphate deaminase
MTVEVLDSYAAVSRRVQDLVSAAVTAAPRLTLGLPTGRTPRGLYAGLATAGLDWSRVRTFNLDEFAGLGPRAPGSFRAFMDAHLFRHVNIEPGSIGFLRGDAPDLDAECARYEADLVADHTSSPVPTSSPSRRPPAAPTPAPTPSAATGRRCRHGP